MSWKRACTVTANGEEKSDEVTSRTSASELHLYVGKAINSAYQNPGLPFDLGIRQNLVEQLKTVVEEMGKQVTVTYY